MALSKSVIDGANSMKITIQNLGIIKKAEIDLKPLTVFVGPNNTGKTWTAYVLASIFSPYGFTKYRDAYIRGDIPNIYLPLDKAVEEATRNGIAVIDLVQFVSAYGEPYLNDVAQFTPQWISSFLGTDFASFEHLNISIDFTEKKGHILEYVLNSSLRKNISGSQAGKSSVTIRKARGDKEVFIYLSKEDINPDNKATMEQSEQVIPPTIIKDFLFESIMPILHRAVYPHVRILPTERTAFIAHPMRRKGQKTEESPQNQTTSETKLKTAPVPIGFFFDMMESASNNETRERVEGEKSARNTRQIKEYIQLAQLLEKQILGGQVKFSQTQLLYPNREILFQTTSGSTLEIGVTSSMVKELSSLLFYLRYLAVPGELIVIDEPEMNLHPEAQVKMIELLAILANNNLNVLITTHSPYIVDHLTNLIKANEAENKENIRSAFYLKRTDAFISKDKVSVCLFDQGQVIQAIDEEGIIELNTFGQVSDQISDIYFNL